MTGKGFWRGVRATLIGLAAVAGIAYCGVVGYLYLNQTRMEYVPPPPGEEIPDITGLAIQDVRIRTPDGETIEAWYEPPQPGRPVMLFLHGNGSSLAMGKWRYIRMHKQGVGYLAIAYRGYSGSTGKLSEKGLLIDGVAGYDWLKAKGFKDSDIVVHGHSLGTGVATWVATQRPARALVLEAPFTAASDVGAEQYPWVPVELLMRDKYMSRKRIRDVHMPVLIAHGTKDQVIPFHQGERLFALANEPKTFVRMEGSGHNTLVRDGLYDHIWTFLGLEPKDYAPEMVIKPAGKE